MLALAAQHGLVVLLDPAETGSFLSVLDSQRRRPSRATTAATSARRYRDFDNIVWMSGNDFQSWPNPGDDAVVQAVARGIQDTDDRHIHTVELDYPVSGSLDDPDLGAADRAERVVHLLPDLRAGAGRLQPPERAADVPGRGELRVRAQRRRRGHAEDPAAPGVLEPAQRRRGPALRQSLHVAVRRRLAEQSRHAGLAPDGLREVPVRVAAAGTT